MVQEAVEASGGQVIFTSGPSSAPLFLGSEDQDGRRFGATAYVFSVNRAETKHRPDDEHRAQIRYGNVNDAEWRDSDHPLGFDPAGVEPTLVLLAHHEAGLIIALDPFAYDPLPIGNSIYFKDEDIEQAQRKGWHVWERGTQASKRRDATERGLETVVGLRPDRFFDLLSLERQAQVLQLDQPLRYRLAEEIGLNPGRGRHELEQDFELSAAELLDIIRGRNRLAVAMRGGVAEHHLGLALAKDRLVADVVEGTSDGPPDFIVTMADGAVVRVECKNASPNTYADGTAKVEVQKTRASKNDPASRFYSREAFDVVAACLYGPNRRWEFVYCRSTALDEHTEHDGRIAPLQRIDDRWSRSLDEALRRRSFT